MKSFLQKYKWAFVLIFIATGVYALGNSSNTTPQPASVYTSHYQQQQPTPSTASNLSNNNSYTNTDGNIVHSPAYSTDGQIPVGASARCGDGTYSFSRHRQGTCSHHGGVSEWL